MKMLRIIAVCLMCSMIWALGPDVLNANAPQVVESHFPHRPAVKAEVERVFTLASDVSGIESLSIVNPASQSVLVLTSFGEGVGFMATIYEMDDDEVQGDTEEWISEDEAPAYVQGTKKTILNAAKATAMEQVFSAAAIDYEIEYLVNYNSENEVAAYDKIIRSQIKKSNEPAGSNAVMEILDDVFEYDWGQTTTKRVVVPPSEEG